ncbi:TPA: restriction endonuclease subunit S [Acinetobacter baumannii]|nr:restriction endonuclease subunit S [Acinetobacter baumannii]
MEKKLQYISSNSKNSFVDGPFGSDLKTDDYKDSGIPLIQLNNIRDGKHFSTKLKFITESKKNELSRHIALPNDVVIAKMADPVARAAIVNSNFSEYVIVADCVKLTPNNKLVDINYLVWAINSSYVRNNAEIVSNGTTRIRINLGELKKLKIPYPSLSEQTQIANFLDQETTKIDTLIAKQEKLIELLEEQRKSIISHAVTKGLNPNVPMKDSGVEWLGQVPEHWMTPSSKHLLEIPITDGPHETPNFVDDGIPFISAEAISKGKIDFDKKRGYITPELNAIYSKKYSPKVEDIYMVKSGATTGKVAMVETTETFNIWSPLAVFRCNKNKVLPKFLLAVFNSSHFYDALVLNWSYGTQQNIGMGVLSNIEIPCPPLKEQAEIIQHLDVQNTKFDKLIGTQSQLIEKLKEYRSSIISHAVTGKIDVREFC